MKKLAPLTSQKNYGNKSSKTETYIPFHQLNWHHKTSRIDNSKCSTNVKNPTYFPMKITSQFGNNTSQFGNRKKHHLQPHGNTNRFATIQL